MPSALLARAPFRGGEYGQLLRLVVVGEVLFVEQLVFAVLLHLDGQGEEPAYAAPLHVHRRFVFAALERLHKVHAARGEAGVLVGEYVVYVEYRQVVYAVLHIFFYHGHVVHAGGGKAVFPQPYARRNALFAHHYHGV